MVRLALKHFGLEPNKDVAILPMGGQPEAFAAMQLVKVPRPSLKAIQIFIDSNYRDKVPAPKPEHFVDNSLVDQLERSGFIDSIYK
jgi:hypothetical protein